MYTSRGATERLGRRRGPLARSFLTALVLLLVPPASAQASTYRVTTAADMPDVAPGDGVCESGGGSCSLRAAVQEANARGGDDVVVLPSGRFGLDLAGANEDGGASGDLDVGDPEGTLTIRGRGIDETVVDGLGQDRVLHALPDARLRLRGLTVTGGRPPRVGGGGILADLGSRLDLDRVRITGNSTVSTGGGLFARSGASLLGRRVLVDGNATSGVGGGLAARDTALALLDSAVVRNLADADGGGLFLNAVTDLDPSSSAVLWNVTLSENRAGAQGGAIFSLAAPVVLASVTVGPNVAAGSGDALAFIGLTYIPPRPQGFRLINTIVSGSCSGLASGPGGGLLSFGHNIESGTTCDLTAPSDRRGTDPLLGKLVLDRDTATHPLLEGSPAIDGGAPIACLPRDQRGTRRVRVCDVGAREYEPAS